MLSVSGDRIDQHESCLYSYKQREFNKWSIATTQITTMYAVVQINVLMFTNLLLKWNSSEVFGMQVPTTIWLKL